MQRSYRELLGILCLPLITLATSKMRILIQVLTTLEALLRPCAYIIRRLGRPPPQPFRFLDLPPEIRIIVYEHHFSLYRPFWNQQQVKNMALPPNPILNLNRLIYREAAHVLYSQATSAIKIAYPKSVYSLEKPIAVKLQKMSHVLIRMRVIRLEIRWPDCGWLAWSEEGEGCGHPIRQLKENIETVCAYLASMPNLRTVKISFLTQEDWPGWSPLLTAKYRMLDLLRPLEMIRRENAEVVVEMPDGCPVSTAELATHQKHVPCRRGFGRLAGAGGGA